MEAGNVDAIRLHQCAQCGAFWALSPYACGVCGATALRVVSSGGRGQVRARSTVHRAPDAHWAARRPYTLVLVRLDEGPTMMGHADADIGIGDTVTARPWEVDGTRLWRFEATAPP
ncbi:hypothetical protein FOZ76_00900 [Verticiella sediminum]|uniref:ChsH2 C-terminal OB-fold domain-containing protein n=1 Tax=Verticiella sediminum TaxID=1247510 RepID=A0A556B190_9BURK|nr:OB-fold domain-containing protein [Verticiella sediminum]TSH98961.1 hypothetical protein FOZ76_00900 [Verticiella sediminum]